MSITFNLVSMVQFLIKMLFNMFAGFPHRRTGTSTLIVVLDDVNDNGPRLVDPVVHIVENMPIGSHTIPREILAVDDDDNKIGHGPPFRMVPTNGSQANPFLEFIFHEGGYLVVTCLALSLKYLFCCVTHIYLGLRFTSCLPNHFFGL